MASCLQNTVLYAGMYFRCRESPTTVESVIESNVFHGIQQIRQTCEHIDCGNGLRTDYVHSSSDVLLLEIVLGSKCFLVRRRTGFLLIPPLFPWKTPFQELSIDVLYHM